MPLLLVWLLAPGLMFIGFGLLGGSSLAVQTRPHFWTRVSVLCLGMLAAVLGLFGAAELKLLSLHVVMGLWLGLVVGALIAAPAVCYRSAGSAEDGGGGDADSAAPSGPRGGVPLPDAGQSDARVRDHTGPRPRDHRPRRAAREPARGRPRVRRS